MKHMLIMRATQEAADAFAEMDFEAVINAMGAYNEQLIKAGVMVAGDGLAPEPGYVVDFSGETPIVSDGPYGRSTSCSTGSGSCRPRPPKRPWSGPSAARWAPGRSSRCGA